MNSFIVLSCVLVVAAASPYGYQNGYQSSRYPSYQQQYQPSYQRSYQPSYQPSYQSPYQYSAPVAPAAPVRLVQTAPVAPVAATGFAGFGLETLLSLIPSAGSSLSKASGSLDNLMKGLPAALANMDPAVKEDFRKVNVIIAEVCSKMVDEAKPETYSYYTPAGIKVTCDFINKTANDIYLGLNDPAIIQSYTDKLQKFTKSLQDQADVYSSIF